MYRHFLSVRAWARALLLCLLVASALVLVDSNDVAAQTEVCTDEQLSGPYGTVVGPAQADWNSFGHATVTWGDVWDLTQSQQASLEFGFGSTVIGPEPFSGGQYIEPDSLWFVCTNPGLIDNGVPPANPTSAQQVIYGLYGTGLEGYLNCAANLFTDSVGSQNITHCQLLYYPHVRPFLTNTQTTISDPPPPPVGSDQDRLDQASETAAALAANSDCLAMFPGLEWLAEWASELSSLAGLLEDYEQADAGDDHNEYAAWTGQQQDMNGLLAVHGAALNALFDVDPGDWLTGAIANIEAVLEAIQDLALAVDDPDVVLDDRWNTIEEINVLESQFAALLTQLNGLADGPTFSSTDLFEAEAVVELVDALEQACGTASDFDQETPLADEIGEAADALTSVDEALAECANLGVALDAGASGTAVDVLGTAATNLRGLAVALVSDDNTQLVSSASLYLNRALATDSSVAGITVSDVSDLLAAWPDAYRRVQQIVQSDAFIEAPAEDEVVEAARLLALACGFVATATDMTGRAPQVISDGQVQVDQRDANAPVRPSIDMSYECAADRGEALVAEEDDLQLASGKLAGKARGLVGVDAAGARVASGFAVPDLALSGLSAAGSSVEGLSGDGLDGLTSSGPIQPGENLNEDCIKHVDVLGPDWLRYADGDIGTYDRDEGYAVIRVLDAPSESMIIAETATNIGTGCCISDQLDVWQDLGLIQIVTRNGRFGSVTNSEIRTWLTTTWNSEMGALDGGPVLDEILEGFLGAGYWTVDLGSGPEARLHLGERPGDEFILHGEVAAGSAPEYPSHLLPNGALAVPDTYDMYYDATGFVGEDQRASFWNGASFGVLSQFDGDPVSFWVHEFAMSWAGAPVGTIDVSLQGPHWSVSQNAVLHYLLQQAHKAGQALQVADLIAEHSTEWHETALLLTRGSDWPTDANDELAAVDRNSDGGAITFSLWSIDSGQNPNIQSYAGEMPPPIEYWEAQRCIASHCAESAVGVFDRAPRIVTRSFRDLTWTDDNVLSEGTLWALYHRPFD